MRNIYYEAAKTAIDRVIFRVDPDDWDQRPEDICKGCGYKTCVCPVQKPQVKNRRYVENSNTTSIDFY